ncbi:MAG TPA: LL-diaminopimelate aminotransferase [Candidatus Eisenbacteria bacterium]|nr:LL-diaminopimelate aminotransferase [Candidatus Eisenbacteria bacterium]
MSFFLEESARLKALPPYLFVEIDRAKRKAIERGVKVIDFGVGDPDQPTPKFIVNAMTKAVKDPRHHHYPLDRGNAHFRHAAAVWLKKRFGQSFNPDTEILPLIGSKEGIAHLPLAFVNPGDATLVPDPCYPPYKSGTLFAGGEAHLMPLREENGFLPAYEAVPADVVRRAKMIFVNYPNNPTGAMAPRSFYEKLVRWASQHKILVVSDLAYSEVYFGKEKPLSIFEIPGAREVAIEFHSLSKTCNMTGWRVGFAIGREEVVGALLRVKSNIDSGVFTAVQATGVEALKNSFGFSKKTNIVYRRRRDLLVSGLRELGFPVKPNPATFYVFTRLPGGQQDSTRFCKDLLERTGIVATPGVGFGRAGEGYVRFTLTVSEPDIREALSRLKKAL